MSVAYDATFSPGAGINDVTSAGTAGLWSSNPSGHWSVSGSTLVGTPAGSAPSFLARPQAEPYPIGTWGQTHGELQPPWGSSQAILALTQPGGWGSSATAWGLALNFSAPGSSPAYYLAEFRPATVTDRPSSVTISRVDGGTSTTLGSAGWTNDTSKDYDFVFESWCEYLGRPVYLTASAIDRATPPPNIHDSNHDLAYGPSGVAVLTVQDAAPGLPNNLQGCPALVALPGTAGATFSRVRLYMLSGFGRYGPRPIAQGWYVANDGTITPYPATAGTPAGLVLPL
jgi:hypothetical protein